MMILKLQGRVPNPTLFGQGDQQVAPTVRSEDFIWSL